MPEEMPWGFKKPEVKEEKDSDSYITDYAQLLATYEREKNRVQNDIDRGYVVINPLKDELIGDDKGNIGMLKELQKMIVDNPLEDTTFGRTTLNLISKSKSLAQWQYGYSNQMRDYVKVFRILCESALKMIKGFKTESEMKDLNMKKMEEFIRSENMEEKKKEVMEEDDRPLTYDEKDSFEGWVKMKIAEYGEAFKRKDKEGMKEIKKKIFDMCGKNSDRTKIAEELVAGALKLFR